MIIVKIILLLILYIILFLIGLLLILVISPIKGNVDADMKHLYFKGSYLFGAIRFYYVDKKPKLKILWFNINLKDDGKEEELDEESNEDEQDEKKEEKAKAKSKKKLKLPNKEVIVLSLNLVKKLISIIAPKGLKLHLRLGLDEPYVVEMMHIYSMIIFAPLNKVKNYDVQFIPMHDEVNIDFEAKARVNFSIIKLIIPCLVYILKKPIREYFDIHLFKRKKKKELLEIKESAS